MKRNDRDGARPPSISEQQRPRSARPARRCLFPVAKRHESNQSDFVVCVKHVSPCPLASQQMLICRRNSPPPRSRARLFSSPVVCIYSAAFKPFNPSTGGKKAQPVWRLPDQRRGKYHFHNI